jgi:hypothetical protein
MTKTFIATMKNGISQYLLFIEGIVIFERNSNIHEQLYIIKEHIIKIGG